MSNAVLTCLIGAAFLLAAYFPIMFYARSNPFDNPASKALFAFSIVAAIILGLGLARQLRWIESDGWRGVVYVLTSGVLLVQDVTMTRVQNRRSKRIARENEDSLR